MLQPAVRKFHECFQIVDDPRLKGRCDHSLHAILFIVVSAVIADADGPAEIESFAIEKQDWLEQFVDLENGVPSHDTIGRVLSLIKPIQFQQALLEWTNQLRQDHRGGEPIRIQIGCQRAIAKRIIEAGGDYIFAVKDNHPKRREAIGPYFIDAHEEGLVESGVRSKSDEAKTRGRQENRFYAVSAIPDSLRELTDQWPGAKSIGQAITTIEKDDHSSTEVRYFLSSRVARVNEFAKSVRSHWSIESMHWVLDVVFHEDDSRIRTGNAIENRSFTRRFVTTLLKQDTSKVSLKGKRKKAGWNTDFLEKLLFGAIV